MSLSLSLSLSLLSKNGAGGLRRISVSGRSPRIPTGGIVPHLAPLPWTKVFPKFLSFSSVLVLLGLGEMHVVFLRFLAKSVQEGFVGEW